MSEVESVSQGQGSKRRRERGEGVREREIWRQRGGGESGVERGERHTALLHPEVALVSQGGAPLAGWTAGRTRVAPPGPLSHPYHHANENLGLRLACREHTHTHTHRNPHLHFMFFSRPECLLDSQLKSKDNKSPNESLLNNA